MLNVFERVVCVVNLIVNVCKFVLFVNLWCMHMHCVFVMHVTACQLVMTVCEHLVGL